VEFVIRDKFSRLANGDLSFLFNWGKEKYKLGLAFAFNFFSAQFRYAEREIELASVPMSIVHLPMNAELIESGRSAVFGLHLRFAKI